MNIRTRHALFTSALVAVIVASLSALTLRVQRRALEGDAESRLEELMVGVERIAQESQAASDPLMLHSYILFLQRERPELATAVIEREGRASRIGSERQGLRLISRSFEAAEGRRMTITLGFVAETLDARLQSALRPLLRRTLALAALFLLAGAAGAALLAGHLTAPLRALAAAARAVGRGDMSGRVPASGDDELGLLAREFNGMVARLKELMEFREDVLHTLTHELNTPLGGLKGHLELWTERELPRDERELRRTLQTMHGAVQRMETSLGNALRLFRSAAKSDGGGPRAVVWVDEVLRDVCRLLEPAARAKGVALRPLASGSVGFLYGREESVRQIATNLVSNAIKFTPEGGEVTLGLDDAGQELSFWVRDTGPGIAAEDLPHLFTKFYRGESERSTRIPGSGLGLSIVKKTVDEIGGRVEVENVSPRGSLFTVTLLKGAKSPAAAGERR